MELFDRGHGQGGDGDGKEDGLGDIPVTTSVLGGGADDSVVDVSVLAGRRGYVHDAGTLQHFRRVCVWGCVFHVCSTQSQPRKYVNLSLYFG